MSRELRFVLALNGKEREGTTRRTKKNKVVKTRGRRGRRGRKRGGSCSRLSEVLNSYNVRFVSAQPATFTFNFNNNNNKLSLPTVSTFHPNKQTNEPNNTATTRGLDPNQRRQQKEDVSIISICEPLALSAPGLENTKLQKKKTKQKLCFTPLNFQDQFPFCFIS